jgi:hypothetical protein
MVTLNAKRRICATAKKEAPKICERLSKYVRVLVQNTRQTYDITNWPPIIQGTHHKDQLEHNINQYTKDGPQEIDDV